ncbi:Smr/MutS family protein [Woodsholea maritima]|uniref:Smr/MutS family protein n=1 Tax=Woodsholea maritima TaxID=240237 RepID=UPI00037A9FDC|nr:Smr/MutS family protein [Woodsholea maritima]
MTPKRPKFGLSSEDRQIWDQITRSVKPIKKAPAPPVEPVSDSADEDVTPARAKRGARSAYRLKKAPDASPEDYQAMVKGYGGASREVMARALAEFQADQRKKRHNPQPVDRGPEKKIRRGQVEVDARIDLHGLTQAEARHELRAFITRAHDSGKKTVLVITGKGANKRTRDERRFQPWHPDERALPGVLRRNFSLWLSEPDLAPFVSGFASAHMRHGGDGAFYVMLRQS